MSNEKKIEIAFITIFSVLIFAIFYTLISLANLGWIPPLYEIVLAMFVSLAGATDIGQMIFLVKALAVIIDWLLFLSVYLLASRFFSKKVGAVASVLLLMCYPMYEVNQFGGYTTVLA